MAGFLRLTCSGVEIAGSSQEGRTAGRAYGDTGWRFCSSTVDGLVDGGLEAQFFLCRISAGCERGQVRVMAAEKQERNAALKGLVLKAGFAEGRLDASSFLWQLALGVGSSKGGSIRISMPLNMLLRSSSVMDGPFSNDGEGLGVARPNVARSLGQDSTEIGM